MVLNSHGDIVCETYDREEALKVLCDVLFVAVHNVPPQKPSEALDARRTARLSPPLKGQTGPRPGY